MGYMGFGFSYIEADVELNGMCLMVGKPERAIF